jgi:predicted RNA-binding protein with PUA-like domain
MFAAALAKAVESWEPKETDEIQRWMTLDARDCLLIREMVSALKNPSRYGLSIALSLLKDHQSVMKRRKDQWRAICLQRRAARIQVPVV